mgnify:CR=1 FL=1
MIKFKVKKSSLKTVGGVIFALLALVILLSPRTPFEFLSRAITTSIGFVGFWLVLPFIVALSIFLILKLNSPKVHGTKVFIGIGMIILVLMVVLSLGEDRYTFTEASKVFSEINKEKTNTYINTALGGGFVGYVLAGALESLVGRIGTYIICSFILLGAIILIFFPQLKKFTLFIVKKTKEKKLPKKEEMKAVEMTSFEEETAEPVASEISTSLKVEGGLRIADFELEIEQPSIKEEKEEIPEEPVVEEKFEESIVEQQEVSSESIKEADFVEEIPAYERKPYAYPSVDLLQYHENETDISANNASCETRTSIINTTLSNFGVGAQVVGYTVGPTVTRYDIKMNPGVSVGIINRYIDDISVDLNGLLVRYEPIVFGKATSGLEVPNEIRTNVGLREAIEKLPVGEKYLRYIPFGKNISGDLISADLSDAPHMLVSGTTGSGKTIFIHSVLITLLMRNRPDELKVMLIDPKKVEMNYYSKIPHLLCPTITDSRQALVALRKLVDEMERRYLLFQTNNVRDFKGYNILAKNKNLKPLPAIVLFVDEFADLMESTKDFREPVTRLCAKARAAGIHMVIATQRPSVNVIDGVIKSNLSTRVALLSASATDSITIIGEGGAEKLLGHGDMLVDSPLLSTSGKPRVQGCYISEEEITSICEYLRNNNETDYDPYFLNLDEPAPETNVEPEIVAIDKSQSEEAQYQSIKEQIKTRPYCSISFIQRTFGMGFPRAGRIFNRLIKEGIVSSETGDAKGSKVLAYSPNNEQQIGSVEQSTFIPDSEESN